MLEFKNVKGTQTKVDGLEFNVDTVYIRSNIRKEKKIDEITKKEHEYWVYDELQYSYNEYTALLDSKLNKVDTTNSTQDDLLFEQAYEISLLKLNSTSTV